MLGWLVGLLIINLSKTSNWHPVFVWFTQSFTQIDLKQGDVIFEICVTTSWAFGIDAIVKFNGIVQNEIYIYIITLS